MFHFGFMQRAFWAGGLLAVVAPLLGMYLLLRRQALFADTLSHVSLAGVAMGIVLGFEPVVGACVVAVCAAMGMEPLRRAYRAYSELSVAIVMTTGLSLALVLISVNQGLNKSFQAYLFGSILAVSPFELTLIHGVFFVAIVFLSVMYRPLYTMTFDEDTAQVSGVPVRKISLFFSIITGLTVAVAMPILGVLLVSAVVVLPAALAVRLASGFRMALGIAVGISLIGMGAGLSASYHMNTPPGATIALLLVLFLLLGLTIKRGVTWANTWRNRETTTKL